MTTATNVLFGYHPVREALLARRRRIDRVYIGQGKGASRREAIAISLNRLASMRNGWRPSR